MTNNYKATKSQEKKYNSIIRKIQTADNSLKSDFEEARGDVHPNFGHFFVKVNTHPHPLIGIEFTGTITRRGKLRIISISDKGGNEKRIANLINQLSLKG